jgi:branched-chain amino acid transport system permease protein
MIAELVRRGGGLPEVAPVVLMAMAAVGFVLCPFVVGNYWIRVLTTIFMFGVLASATNVIAGYTGYPAFGNVVFFGLGAYTTALVMAGFRAPFWLGLGPGALICCLYAVVIGFPILRLRGHYFAIATLGMNEATRAIIENLGFTGGGMGLSLPLLKGDVEIVNRYFYFLMLGLLVGTLGVSFWLSRTRFGYGCRAIRFDEEAAASCGVPTTRFKIVAWVLSALFTGMAGAAYAHWVGYVEPPVVFDMAIAVKMFVMMLLGGSGTVFGPLLGAFLIELVGLVAWTQFLNYHTAALGLIVIAVVIFVPGGLMSLSRRSWSVRLLLDNVRASRL